MREPEYRAKAVARRVLRGGVVAVARDAPDVSPRSSAVIRLVLPAGTSTGETGVAELTAWAVAGVADAAENRPALRHGIEALGGELRLRVGSHAIAYDVIVPVDAWQTALDALLVALRSPLSGSDQIESVRRQLLRERRAQLAHDRIDNALDVVTSWGGVAPDTYLRALEDRTVEQISAFQNQSFQPAGALLALWIPGQSAAEVLSAASTATEQWTGADAPTLVAKPPAAAEVRGGVFWARSESELCDFALVLPEPPLTAPRALEQMLLLECLSMDGVGGRLGQNMTSAAGGELVLHSRAYRNGTSRFRVLWATGSREDALFAWASLQRAIASLASAVPTEEELRLAAQRLRLRLLAEDGDPSEWVEVAANQGVDAQAAFDLNVALVKLEEPQRLNLVKAARDILPRASALLVVGSSPPDGVREGITAVTASVEISDEPEVPPEVPGQIEAAKQYLDIAVTKAGGRGVLSQVRGFGAELVRSTEDGVAVQEVTWFSEPRSVRRVRRLLETTIETVIDETTAQEVAGEEAIELEVLETEHLVNRMRRHPIMLLARWVRGEIVLRLASLRRIDDRDMAILELVDPTVEPLRVTMDAESGLIRAVETREWRPDLGARVQVTEYYDDYRRAGRVRAPFHCTMQSGGAAAPTIDATYADLSFEPVPPEALERGGPRRLAR
jgi:predicted Zn-dependent peptidase